MELIFNLPTYKNGKIKPKAARTLERVTIAYYPKPGGILQSLHPYFSKSSATLDRARHAKQAIENRTGTYVALIEGELITDLAIAIDGYETEELKKCGARGLSFRALADYAALAQKPPLL